MSKKNHEKQNSEENEDSSEEKPEKNNSNKAVESEKPKTKFSFKCTQCNACCLARGPIPITMWDLEMWARNGVVANFLPYLDVFNKPDGGIDLILKPLAPPLKEGEKEEEVKKDPFGAVPIEELLNVKCPLYNKDDKKCLIYENRPLSCRTYPLEFDGKNFIVVDADCPGVGVGEGMTKEDLIKMRETAKTMHYELTRMRIALPVLNQVVSQKIMMDFMRQNLEAMSKMSDEDRAKLDDIFKKNKEQEQI